MSEQKHKTNKNKGQKIKKRDFNKEARQIINNLKV